MEAERKLRFALAVVEGRLHKAVGGKRCGCGSCSHWVAVAAYWARIPRARLEAALAPAAKPDPQRARRARELRVRVCDLGTVRVRGRDVDPREGLAILLARLHDSQ